MDTRVVAARDGVEISWGFLAVRKADLPGGSVVVVCFAVVGSLVLCFRLEGRLSYALISAVAGWFEKTSFAME